MPKLASALLLFLLLTPLFPQDKPKKGYVPDEATAVRIAEAVFIPIYGEKHVRSERPFHARLDGDYWIVKGSLPKPRSKDEIIMGGTMMAEISRQTGEVRGVYHLK